MHENVYYYLMVGVLTMVGILVASWKGRKEISLNTVFFSLAMVIFWPAIVVGGALALFEHIMDKDIILIRRK
uniref:Membrane protein n=1 Tax=Salmonella phage vB_SEnST11_KE23 TaxID=3161174 RepID=A0AAU8GJE8_9CAUD